MAVKIRLTRGGTKKRPFYHIVAADERAPRDGRYIERLGFLNPLLPKDHAERLKIDADRVKYWLGVGAKPTNRVARFLSDLELVAKPAIHAQTKQDKPKAKAQERMRLTEEARKEAEEAKAAAEAAPAEEPAVEEAPAEEATAAEEAPVEEAPAAEAPGEDENKG